MVGTCKAGREAGGGKGKKGLGGFSVASTSVVNVDIPPAFSLVRAADLVADEGDRGEWFVALTELPALRELAVTMDDEDRDAFAEHVGTRCRGRLLFGALCLLRPGGLSSPFLTTFAC